MSNDPGNPPGNTPGDTPPPGDGGTGGTPGVSSGGKTAAQLEAEYKGLQTSYNKMKENSDKSIAEATRKLAEAQAQIEELKQSDTSKTSQLETLTKGADALKQQLETLKAEKGTIEAQLSRNKLVMEKFPGLASLEAQGLLPKGSTDEETLQLLTKFNETLTGMISSGVKGAMAGATPPGSGGTGLNNPPGNPGDETEDFVYGKMLETAGVDQKAYNEWRAKYDAILDKKAAKT
jgi:hypothetical protein